MPKGQTPTVELIFEDAADAEERLVKAFAMLFADETEFEYGQED